MPSTVAVIEDDVPTSNQLRGWIEAARPGLVVHQWFTRDEAEAAIERERYDAVVLDIELGRERHAGVALINAINKQRGTPVLVVSAMPATLYRGIMKALDAWDYLQKTTFEEADFVDTFLDLLRNARPRTAPERTAASAELSIDPLRHGGALWHGKRVNLPLTAHPGRAVRAARRGRLVRRAVPGDQERAQPRQRAQACEHDPRRLPPVSYTHLTLPTNREV